MNTYKVTLEIAAECEDDARELLQDFSGSETDLIIISIKPIDKDKEYAKIERQIEELRVKQTDIGSEIIKLEDKLER